MAAGLIVPALEGLGAAAAWGYRAYRGYRLYQGAKRLDEMSKTGNTLLNEVKPDECTGKCEKVDDKKQRKTPDDVLSDATRDPEAPTLKDGSEQYNKKGGMAEADADFDSMQPNNIKSKPGGIRVGEIEGGTQVVVRPKSPSDNVRPGLSGRDGGDSRRVLKPHLDVPCGPRPLAGSIAVRACATKPT